MEEMRVQIEAREPTDDEIRAFWFTLPIDTEQVEELLGIDVDTDYYYITGKELPFADEVQEDTTVEKLNDLYSTYENLPSVLHNLQSQCLRLPQVHWRSAYLLLCMSVNGTSMYRKELQSKGVLQSVL